MPNPMTTGVRYAAMWSIVLSVLMIAAGVMAIAVPMIAGVAVTALVAWLLIFSGMLHLAFAWRGGRAGSSPVGDSSGGLSTARSDSICWRIQSPAWRR